MNLSELNLKRESEIYIGMAIIGLISLFMEWCCTSYNNYINEWLGMGTSLSKEGAVNGIQAGGIMVEIIIVVLAVLAIYKYVEQIWRVAVAVIALIVHFGLGNYLESKGFNELSGGYML